MQVLGTTSHTVTDKGGIDIFGSPKNPTIIEPACLSVITKGIIPEKAIQKINGDGYFAKSGATVLSPAAYGEIAH